MGKKLQRHLTNFLLGQHHPIGIASVWMHVFCSYSCAVQREIVPKATTCVFLGYAQSGYRCYDVKSKRLDKLSWSAPAYIYIICLLAEHINLMCVLSESTCRNLCLGQENPDLRRIVNPLWFNKKVRIRSSPTIYYVFKLSEPSQ